MNRFLCTCLLSALALVPLAAPAQEDEYVRVEAVVFIHLDGRPDAWPTESLDSFAGVTDPVWLRFGQEVSRARDQQAQAEMDRELLAALEAIETIASIEQGEGSLAEVLLRPEPWLALEQPSGPMAEALARLQRSTNHQVAMWLGWYQPVTGARGPAARLHDEEIIAVDWIDLTPTGRPRREGEPAASAERLMPAFHYRLDGRLQLRRRQFLHADISLQWRQPDSGLFDPGFAGPQRSYALHGLSQSRSIRPGRIEYFDSSWLGLLLQVTPWAPDENEPEDSDRPGDAPSP